MSRVIQGSSRPALWVFAEVVSKRLGSVGVGEVGGSMETGGEERLMGFEVDGGRTLVKEEVQVWIPRK